jgi:nicotinate-nucleotide adenylyltransferase
MKAIFGGTFDPVHFGHLRAATEAVEALGLQELTMLPAGNPPHRGATFASAADRLAMLKLAVSNAPRLRVDDREVRREGYSYMVDTLSEFRAEIGPDQPLALLLGQDAVNGLDSWHEWQRLFELAHIIIMRRPESREVYSGELFERIQPGLTSDLSELAQHAFGCVMSLEVTQLDISSTDIRNRLEQKKSCRYLLPDPVIDYINRSALYLAGTGLK